MWQLLLITGLLGLADANSYTPVDPVTLAGFTNQFRQTIMHLIGAEFKTTDALVQQLKIAMTTCKIAIGTQQGQCKSCAKDSCKPSVNDKIMHFMNLVAKPFVSFGNDIGTWKGWQDMVDWFQGAGQEFVNWGAWDDIEGFFKDIGTWSGWAKDFGNVFKDFGNDIGNYGKNIGNLHKDIGIDIGDFGKNIGNNFGDFGKNIGNNFGDFGKNIGNNIGGFFGRRKRALNKELAARELMTVYRALKKVYARTEQLDPDVRECMETCPVCSPFLDATPDETVGQICGQELLELNRTVFTAMMKLETQYARVADNENLIIRGLRYDVTSMDASDPLNIEFSVALLDAMCSTGYTEYQTADGYLLSKPHVSAALMAKEYFNKNC